MTDKPMDLKPCPFCGSKAHAYFEETEATMEKTWVAHCPTSGCLEDVVPAEIWNRRAPVESVPAPAGLAHPAAASQIDFVRERLERGEAIQPEAAQVLADWLTAALGDRAPIDRASLSPRPATGARECWAYFYTGEDAPATPMYWAEEPTEAATGGVWVRMVEAPTTGADQGGAT